MKFSIRDILWATALVALAVCWWLDRSGLQNKNIALQSELKKTQESADMAWHAVGHMPENVVPDAFP
jgi:hypothetical protein